MYQNYDLENIVTPVKPDVLEQLLVETNYNKRETQFVIQGFREGFDLEYAGLRIRQSTSRNIPFTVGNKIVLWNKLMKEVKCHRVAGPFKRVPFDNFIQSPIGLVPKAGDKTRLIFHLSYNFGDKNSDKSVNYHTPRDKCSVHYRDLDHTVQNFLKVRANELLQRKQEGSGNEDETPIIIFSAKSDLESAFRVLPLKRGCWAWLVMCAQNPKTGEWEYFIDKCLPFGASISCAHFQQVSNALRHVVEVRTATVTTNYLDDFLFVAITIVQCNYLVTQFLLICEMINFPVSKEKTVRATDLLVFLGILLNGRHMQLAVPLEKRIKAEQLLMYMIDKTKVTIRKLQVLCGYLNFLNKAIFPGRAFTRRMYAKYSNCLKGGSDSKLKQYHHMRLDQEFKLDCRVWLEFLQLSNSRVVNRPMVDLSTFVSAHEIFFYSDASASKKHGFGCIFGKRWIFGKWGEQFVLQNNPSIAYLELFALTAGLDLGQSTH